jgi:DGQHR domain-containing protein
MKGAPRTETTDLSYEAFVFSQRKDGATLVLFHAPASEVLSWSQVGVLRPDEQGHQREKRETKVQAIKKFLQADKCNLIPTAVVLAFAPGAARYAPASGATSGRLIVKASPNSANIVDGQHRLFGLSEFNSEAQVAVVAFLDANEVEKAFQFLVINNKSTRVAAPHAKAILANMKDTPLIGRLRGARLAFDMDGIRDVDLLNTDPDSPFHNLIDWSITHETTRLVQASAIESSLSYLGSLSVPELEDRDSRRTVFMTIWKATRRTWPSHWDGNSRLISKVGVICLTRFVIDTISTWADSDRLEIDILDTEQIDALTREILNHMDPSFWTSPWSTKAPGGFDTNQGRERIVKALTQLYRNGRRGLDWADGIEIIDSTGA